MNENGIEKEMKKGNERGEERKIKERMEGVKKRGSLINTLLG